MIVTAAGHEPTAAALLTQPGSGLERDFTLAGSGALSGVVRSAGQGGAQLAGVKVEISDRSGRVVASAVTSGDGEFTVAGAPAGSYRPGVATLPAGNGRARQADITLTLPE